MSIALFWFRKDLRITDNPGLFEAMQHHDQVILLYILDETLGAAQRWWLALSLLCLQRQLEKKGTHLVLYQGNPATIIDTIINTHPINALYWNRLYTPDAINRDKELKSRFQSKGLSVHTFNASLLHEPWQIKSQSGTPFKVFTPYWKAAYKNLIIPENKIIKQWKSNPHLPQFTPNPWSLLPTRPNWACDFPTYWQPGELGAQKRLTTFLENYLNPYSTHRDIPALDGTSKLSPHLHFGEISPHQIWRQLQYFTAHTPCNTFSIERFQTELGWREFSSQLLYYFPQLPQNNFKPQFNTFPWQTNNVALKIWQQGKTGYPLIDAGMRELWHTGYMHNRVRMIVASFLTKDLLIDWREGAKWFWETLLDADLANNSFNWQWVAGCGADAAPYFRIFNPLLQSKKFDPEGIYIKRWIPELQHLNAPAIHQPWTYYPSLNASYPPPIIDHEKARHFALSCYQAL